eukprot:COSAG06_NODE_808_length_12164_cov_76.683382_7_plen_78_part_00
MVFYILCAYCCRCRPHPTVAIPPYTPVARCCCCCCRCLTEIEAAPIPRRELLRMDLPQELLPIQGQLALDLAALQVA